MACHRQEATDDKYWNDTLELEQPIKTALVHRWLSGGLRPTAQPAKIQRYPSNCRCSGTWAAGMAGLIK